MIPVHVNGLRRPEGGVAVRDTVLIVIREQSLLPNCTSGWAVPLMRRKFVEDCNLRVAHGKGGL